MDSEELAALLKREGSGLSLDEYDEASQPDGARQRRTEALAAVLEVCQEASAQDATQLEGLAKALGDGSRDMGWRLPYAEAGILGFFLEALASQDTSDGLKIQALRIAGNCCADTDENRARVVEGAHLANIISHIENPGLIPYVVPVLFNILTDYEPAQLLASKSHLNNRITALLDSPRFPSFAALLTYLCKILSMLITQDGEADVANPDTVQILLKLATGPLGSEDAEDFILLVSTAASYLANEKLQETFVAGKHMDLFMTAFYNAHTSFDPEELDEHTGTLLKKLCTSLLTTLADITGLDSFTTLYPLDSSVPRSLLAWLQGSNSRLQSAACLALGNICRSDEASTTLVQTLKIHEPLIQVLSNPSITDTQLLHSALSFLKNLAIPSQNKPVLGGLLEPTSVPRILTLDTLPQVQFAAVSLTRLLLVNCAPNVRLVCAPRKAESSEATEKHTTVHDILSVFSRSDAEPTKLEAARSIAAICRVLHTTSAATALPDWAQPDDGDNEQKSLARQRFYDNHDLTKTLSFLVSQQKWPILRSEAWFVFAVMARSEDGAGVVVGTLAVQEATAALAYSITGENEAQGEGENAQAIEAGASVSNSGDVAAMTEGMGLQPQQVDPKQQANMVKVDRENCLVLCTEILKNSGKGLEASQLATLEELVKKGTTLMGADKLVTK